MANAKRNLKISTYTVVADAVESGIEVGLNRAYKHSDERLSEAQRQQILTHAARAIMDQLSDVIDWDDGNDD